MSSNFSQTADYPSTDELLACVLAHMYKGPTLNNSHRGDLVEALVLMALGKEWRFVGLGWHPWDIERSIDGQRIRIQVKQTAALQLWGPTKRSSISFGWSKKPPEYFERDNPGQAIEACGWFCEVFVIGVHQNDDPGSSDQVDPSQWRFLVIPICDLAPGTNSMVLGRALDRWSLVRWHELADAVETAIDQLSRSSPMTADL